MHLVDRWRGPDLQELARWRARVAAERAVPRLDDDIEGALIDDGIARLGPRALRCIAARSCRLRRAVRDSARLRACPRRRLFGRGGEIVRDARDESGGRDCNGRACRERNGRASAKQKRSSTGQRAPVDSRVESQPCAPLSRFDANNRHFGCNRSGQQRFPRGRKRFRLGG